MRKRNQSMWRTWGVIACLLSCTAAGCSSVTAVQTGTRENGAAVQTDTGENGAAVQAAEQTRADAEQEQQAVATDGLLTVTFLDVGQGNAVLVESEGNYMLIDGGDREYASFVVSYLKNAGVEELAYVISSHYDADHLNGVVGVLNAFPCELVLASDYVTDTRVYDSFSRVVDEKDITLAYPAVGASYVLGDAAFTIVCPDSYTYSDVNDNSIGIRITHGKNSFLICGDAGEKSERAMLENGVTLESDVYLASHHGSDGSSSWEFLQAVSPEAVVFSVGADNSYGHPAERVLSDVQSLGAEIYRTDEQGTLVVSSDGETLSWNAVPKEAVPAEAAATAADTQALQETYVLNRSTKKFHKPSCSSADDISKENRANFTGTRQELLEAGYEACKRCNP